MLYQNPYCIALIYFLYTQNTIIIRTCCLNYLRWKAKCLMVFNNIIIQSTGVDIKFLYYTMFCREVAWQRCLCVNITTDIGIIHKGNMC